MSGGATGGAAAGDVVADRYLLTSILGEGGMGAVWLARDLRLEVDIALKFIRRDVATPTTSERLLQEARAAARLGHPSIVRVFDFGQSESGDPFMAMEVLHGELLSEVFERKGRLAAPNAICTLLPVASALAAAHTRGIVHRDLKPDNILLVTDDSGSVVPKVLDFGIAKLRDPGVQTRITQDHAILGTPDYMSPEQASGLDQVDARADVWSLCVLVYEAMTGQPPFRELTPTLTLISIATKEPVPTTEYAAGDEALWKIIERGLMKDPNDRWPTMRDLGGALARWAVDNGADTDVAGTSLLVHWLQEGQRRPLSEAPSAQYVVRGGNVAGGQITSPDGELGGDVEQNSGSHEMLPPSSQQAVAAAPTVPAPAKAGKAAPHTIQMPTTPWPPVVIGPPAGAPPISPVMHMELPDELHPDRRGRWLFWAIVIIVVGIGAYYFFREAPAFQPLWQRLEGRPTAAPVETTEAAPATVAPPPEPSEPPSAKASASAAAKPSAPPSSKKPSGKSLSPHQRFNPPAP